MVLARSFDWPMKSQAGGTLGLQAEYRIPLRARIHGENETGLSAGLGAGWHYTFASDLRDGYLYRGYTGLEARLSFGWAVALQMPAGEPPMRVGLQAETLARLDRYAWTELYFFYPGLSFGPFLELGPGRASRFSYRILVPLDFYFRRDLAHNSALGLSVSLLYHPRGASSAP